jgi:hypothetical protein
VCECELDATACVTELTKHTKDVRAQDRKEWRYSNMAETRIKAIFGAKRRGRRSRQT